MRAGAQPDPRPVEGGDGAALERSWRCVRRAAAARAESRRLRTGARRHVRIVHRRAETLVERLDLARARRTVPRGSTADDWHQRPAVSFGVWFDHVRYARTGDGDRLAALVRQYETYAVSLAYRMHRDREPLEDLEQVAREALVHALQRFDPERGIPFPAFASPTILGSLRRHFRDHGWSVRVPRNVHEIAGARHQAVERLTGVLGREPSTEEIAGELDIEVEDLVSAEGAVRARATDSLDAPLGEGPQTAGEGLADPRDGHLALEDHMALADAMDVLGEREREILELYYVQDQTQTQIAERYGVSQMQVSRWLASIVARLRSHMVPA